MDQNGDSIRINAFLSVFWKFFERIIAQVVSLLVSIILARLLSPDDYGLVGIVSIFFVFANVIISGGLNTALIQKKNADALDYSTVLYVSVFLSIILYAALFVLAPFIATVYQKEALIKIIRVMALSLPIYAIKSIVCAYISSTLQFKKFFFATIGGTLVSAVVGIWMALSGFGAWALVAQQLTNTYIDTLILYTTTCLPFTWRISFSRLKQLFSYGWKVFASSILSAVYAEAIPAFIGLKFNATSLSYYSKGRSFPNLMSTTTTSTLSAVLFPVMAHYQNDRSRLLQYTRKYIKLTSYIVCPIMLGFFAVSDNFILILLTEKWLPASFYIKVFCLVSLFEVIHIGNCETIKAMGRSDVFLIMEIIKKSSYFLLIAVFMFFSNSPQILAISSLACSSIAIIVNSIPNIKLINYSVKNQIVDFLPNFVLSLIMCITTIFAGKLFKNYYISFVFQVFVGVLVYVSLSAFTKNENFLYFLSFLKNKFKGLKKGS